MHLSQAACNNGLALVMAAEYGHGAVVKLLLREHAPRADCQNGRAFVMAARALVMAARNGHEAVVLQLLKRLMDNTLRVLAGAILWMDNEMLVVQEFSEWMRSRPQFL